jgi:hypothetical protein
VADQRTGHVCGNDQKLLGKPDIIFIRMLGRQSGEDEVSSDVLPVTSSSPRNSAISSKS